MTIPAIQYYQQPILTVTRGLSGHIKPDPRESRAIDFLKYMLKEVQYLIDNVQVNTPVALGLSNNLLQEFVFHYGYHELTAAEFKSLDVECNVPQIHDSSTALVRQFSWSFQQSRHNLNALCLTVSGGWTVLLPALPPLGVVPSREISIMPISTTLVEYKIELLSDKAREKAKKEKLLNEEDWRFQWRS